MKTFSRRRVRRGVLLTAVVATALPLGAQPATGVQATSPETTQMQGVFPDGQEWQISVPDNWNGVVINDLDAVPRLASGSPIAEYFLENGYAYTGTRRHPDRSFNWDPPAESNNMAAVLDIFSDEFGEPATAIQYGCSGGGSVGLSVAEDHPDIFDGVISMHASDPITLANMRLDLSVALKGLLDEDDVLPLIIDDGEQAEASEIWTSVLAEAAQSDQGRARMALALVMAQYPIWGSGPKPDFADNEAVQQSVVDAAAIAAVRAVTGRPMWDQPAGLMSWNEGVDYRRFYNHADPSHQEIVRDLYADAGLSPARAIPADLERINAQPRISATSSGVEYFRSRMRTGDVKIPMLHASTIGDASTPPSVMARDAAAVTANGASSLYRQAFIEAPGHCTHNVAEVAALLDTLEERIETGTWGDTKPGALNQSAAESGQGIGRFVPSAFATGWKLPTTLNRAFLPGTTWPGDAS